ncbi:PH domain-containing protein [Pseudodesulfovibrio sp. zrk46]|uniref:PH domain-containing protein n=1 Tax=Pseudodesulfovibrio sp. zrk46 TaxID=2725288 RepID=UPI001448AA8A|nr:PH domain-containing protein [Pseudodesulfovibrio sp. zrk46]QJB55134.1 PH domain-containing protein [Pseudodesulfovibrio sp. zrk46]
MGLLDKVLGNAAEVDVADIQNDFAPILATGETVVMAYKVIRDMFVFTNKRLVLVDKQGMTGKKVDYLSLPYKSITRFSVETSGHFDMDAELKIWMSGTREPIIKELKKGTDVVGVQRTLAEYVLK